MSGDIVERLESWETTLDQDALADLLDDAADEIERLRVALSLAVGELSTHGNHRHETPDMLRDQFIEEARRG